MSIKIAGGVILTGWSSHAVCDALELVKQRDVRVVAMAFGSGVELERSPGMRCAQALPEAARGS